MFGWFRRERAAASLGNLSPNVGSGEGGSNVLPRILSVTDGGGGELLVPEDLAVKGAKATLRLDTPVIGGDLTVTLGARDGTAGAMTVNVQVKEPKGYAYSRPGDPCVFR